MLGLCSKYEVEPSATISGGGSELGFPIALKITNTFYDLFKERPVANIIYF